MCLSVLGSIVLDFPRRFFFCLTLHVLYSQRVSFCFPLYFSSSFTPFGFMCAPILCIRESLHRARISMYVYFAKLWFATISLLSLLLLLFLSANLFCNIINPFIVGFFRFLPPILFSRYTFLLCELNAHTNHNVYKGENVYIRQCKNWCTYNVLEQEA